MFQVQSLDKPVGVLEDLLWGIVVEDNSNPNAFIQGPMHQSYLDGNFNKVPMLTGYTSQEILFFMRSK